MKHTGKVKIKVAPPPLEQEALKQMILKADGTDVLTQVMINIDSRKMQATVPEDLERIKNLIEDPDHKRAALVSLRKDVIDGNFGRVPGRIQCLLKKKGKASAGDVEDEDFELMSVAIVSPKDATKLNKVKKMLTKANVDNAAVIQILDEMIAEVNSDLFLGRQYLNVDNIYKVMSLRTSMCSGGLLRPLAVLCSQLSNAGDYSGLDRHGSDQYDGWRE
jgi:hypothetical protein